MSNMSNECRWLGSPTLLKVARCTHELLQCLHFERLFNKVETVMANLLLLLIFTSYDSYPIVSGILPRQNFTLTWLVN
jgi:hypothetical protein